MQPNDIYNKSDQRSKARADKQNLNAKLYKVDGNKIMYTVESSEHNKNYLVTIQLLDLKSDKLSSLSSALEGSIKISCTCPAFLYRGFKYISWKVNVGIEPENRAPNITNPDRKGLACKHILTVLDQLKSDYQSIYNKFKEQIPDSSSTANNIKDNNKSDGPTESDLLVIDEFKKACDKLYKDYIKFINSNPGDDATFVDSKYYDKTDPTKILLNLSKNASKYLNGRFIGKLKSLDTILSVIDSKKNGFNILLNSDISYIIRKLNSLLQTKTESLINNIILSLLDYT